MTAEIIKELTKTEENKDVTSGQVPSICKLNRSSEDTNSSFEHFKSRQGIWCHLIRKDKIISHNTAKQEHANTTDQATHLKDAQHMGGAAGNMARWTTLELYAETKDTVSPQIRARIRWKHGREWASWHINFINFSPKSPGIISELKTSHYQNSAKISYEVDTGSNCNCLLFYVYSIP